MAPSTSNRDLLWILPRWCFPADDGAKIASYQLLHPLAARGWRIHLLALPPRWETPQAPAPDWITSQHTVLRGAATPKTTRIRALFSLDLWARGVAYPLVAFRAEELRETCEHLLNERQWAAVVVDGLHGAASLPTEMPRGTAIVYRAHNIESDILLRAAKEKGVLPWMFLMWQGQALARFERELVRRAALTCPVSETDAEIFRGAVPGARIEPIPIGLDFPSALPAPAARADAPVRIFFAGRLDWEPNRDGLEAFLKTTWRALNREAPRRLELRIAGRGDASWLDAYRDWPGVSVLGGLETLEGEYAAADACLIPLRYGSGVRVKAIEAVQRGRALISTALGVEGLGLPQNAYFNCEQDEDWRRTLLGWNRNDAAARAARAFENLRLTFSESSAAARFDELLTAVAR